MLYHDNAIDIYFGDSSDELFMNDDAYLAFQHAPALLKLAPFIHLAATNSIQELQFPRQVHGTQGFILDAQTMTTVKPFSIESDYIITNVPHIGVGILTADCLPILLHDTRNNVIAAIHAGWRGSVAGIAIKALEQMKQTFKTDPADIRVFFGPSACQCCYTVGPEVIQAVKPYAQEVLHIQDNNVYFNLPHYNRILLEQAGVLATAFCATYSQCTICNNHFWSYRRQQQKAGRQMTVISLQQGCFSI